MGAMLLDDDGGKAIAPMGRSYEGLVHTVLGNSNSLFLLVIPAQAGQARSAQIVPEGRPEGRA